jgi:hypothetical protein
MTTGTPRLVFGDADRDRYTLRRVIELRLVVVLQCRNCRHVSQFDAIGLVERYGAEGTLGTIRRKALCRICRHQDADILMKVPSPRSKEVWWPRPPWDAAR